MEIGRRCTTLLNTVAKEFEPGDGKANGEAGKGRGRGREDEDEEIEEEAPAKKKTKNGAVVCDKPRPLSWIIFANMQSQQNKQVKAVKGGSKSNSASTSRAASVSSNTAPKSKSRKK